MRASWVLISAAVLSLGPPGLARAQGFQVGHATATFLDAARGGRSVSTEIYYPADIAGEAVPVAASAASLPVLSFGHGFLIPTSAYTYLSDALVPEGFVVVLPNTEGGLLPNHLEFGRDLAFAAASLQAEGQNPASLFFQKIGTSSALMGHSMGGGASLLGASEAPFVTAVANLAAAETNPSAIAAASLVQAPTLVLAGTSDCVTPIDVHQRPMYDALASDCASFVQILEASHCRFADFNFTCTLGELGCPAPAISESEQHQTVLDFLLPWLNFHLKGEAAAGALFQSRLAQDPRVLGEQDCAAVDVPAVFPEFDPSEVPIRLTCAPNPFRREIRIELQLDQSGPVRVDVYDVAGRRVQSLADRTMPAGRRSILWDGRGLRGERLTAGVYTVRVRSREDVSAARVTLVR